MRESWIKYNFAKGKSFRKGQINRVIVNYKSIRNIIDAPIIRRTNKRQKHALKRS